MNKGYQISNDGTIFAIKDDGSISRLAKINAQGRLTDLEGREMSSNRSTTTTTASTTSDNDGKGWYWFFIVVFALTAIILGVLYSEADQNYYWANQERWEYKNKYETAIRERDEYKAISESSASFRKENTSLKKENSSLKTERDNAKSELSSLKSKVSITYPIIITDIEIANIYASGNVQTNYGNKIYSYSTMYLQPRIKYTGLTSGNKTIKVKWYNPDGTIRSGSSSPSGFSQSESLYVYNGENNTYTLNGWGNASMGNWSKGTYRIEIWYENTCLKAKTFTIY